MSFEQTLNEAVAKCISLIDSGKIEEAKEILKNVGDALCCLNVIQMLLKKD